ncbi:CHAD domain-containing protein [Bradyrhizobium sp. F1.13.1]
MRMIFGGAAAIDARRSASSALADVSICSIRHWNSVVEHADVVVGIVQGVAHEEIGDAAQRLDPVRDGAVRERSLQFLEQTFG